MNTKKCTEILHCTLLHTSYLLVLLLLAQCGTSDKKNRPSPLAADSITIGETKMSITYSSPRVRGRQIWNTKLVPYGRVWRTGANEATVFETSKEIRLNDRPLPPGKYAVFSIPDEDRWTIVFNKVWEQWGSYAYDPADDIVRLSIAPSQQPDLAENMEFQFTEDRLTFRWEYLTFDILIETF